MRKNETFHKMYILR